MNSLPPIPPSDPGFQFAGPMEYRDVSPAPKLRLQKFLAFLRKFWWVPLITLIISLGVAGLDFHLSPPEFVASASMWETEKLQLPEGAAFSEDPQTYFGTLTAVLQSDTLRQLALTRMKNEDTNTMVLDKDGNPIGVEISVFQAPKSSVFTIQAISSNPTFTPAYLNALMNAYLEYKKVVRKQVSGDTLASISAQVLRLEQDLNADQAVLAQFEQTNDLVVLEQENQLAGGYLAKLKTQLADYQLQTKLLDAVALEKNSGLSLGTTNMASPLYDALVGNNLPGSPATASEDAYQQIESLKFQRARLSKYLRPAHPKIIKLDEEIAQAQHLIEVYRKESQGEISTARRALKIRIDSVRQAINEWEDKVNYDSARIAQAETLKANIARNQSLYDRLESLVQNVDLTRNIDQDTLAILQPAASATRSYRKLQSNLSLASFVGLALGLGIVLLIAVRDDRFASLVEVTEKIGDGIIGQVPEMPRLNHGLPLALLDGNNNQHMYVESYRNLRSAIHFLAVDGTRPKLLLVTSAVPNEGKSTIASNLACTMASGGARVLLIDGDLRKGRLHDLLQLNSKPGFAEMLRQPEAPENLIIQASPFPNLSFIARGSSLRNPGDLFLTPAFDGILARFREQYDYVIIDSVPVFAADDATTLAPKMDGTLFVVRSRFSRSGTVREALELLYQRQAKVLGLVLNRADSSARSYNYYKYSEYHAPAEST